MLSFVSSFIVYYLICLVWPTQNQKAVRAMGLQWEEISYQDIVAVDGTVITNELEGYPDKELMDEKNHAAYHGDSPSPARSVD